MVENIEEQEQTRGSLMKEEITVDAAPSAMPLQPGMNAESTED